MIADEDAYDYMIENDMDLFSDKNAFDGKHGIMVYNRTLQRPGKAHQVKPMDEWIVSVGKHKGVITGKKWIQVQTLLDINKSKSYRYTYLCSTKERSRGHCCSMKNANGNTLDAKLMAQLTDLSKNHSDMFRQLERGKRVLNGDRDGYDAEVTNLKEEIERSEADIRGLVTTLAKVSGTPMEDYVMQQIDELHQRGQGLKKRLEDLEAITAKHALADYQFDILRDVLYSFHDQIDTMTVEQKRNALRLVVKKIVWDGENAHAYLMNDDEEDYDLPEPPDPDKIGGGKGSIPDSAKNPLGEDSKCYPHTAESKTALQCVWQREAIALQPFMGQGRIASTQGRKEESICPIPPNRPWKTH